MFLNFFVNTKRSGKNRKNQLLRKKYTNFEKKYEYPGLHFIRHRQFSLRFHQIAGLENQSSGFVNDI